jgi:DNA polymerase III delta prime subunit
MKKLILIQNDYPGTGKSTLALCFHRYLQQYGVSHQLLSLTEEDSPARRVPRLSTPAR